MREVAVKANNVLNYESRKEAFLDDDSVDLRDVASISSISFVKQDGVLE